MPAVDVKAIAASAFREAMKVSIAPLLEDKPEVARRMETMEREFSFFTERSLAGDPHADADLVWLQEEGKSLAQRHAVAKQTATGKYFEMVLAVVARSVFVALKGALGIPSLPV